ncbi:MAG: serine/threonine protein kinase, partial [Sciscionella sp.]|nr:serine/threonine protein kinase [Sciscionella sp.]
MTAVLRLIGALLAGLHSMLPLPDCRDDWLWSLALAGGVLGLLPMVGSLLVALLRKGTGNRYNVVTCGVFGVIGALCCVVLPWLGFVGVNTIFTTAAHGETVPGVSASLLSSIGKRSCFVGDQRAYLGNAPTVYEVLLHPTETAVAMVIYFGLLVVIPVVGLLFMIMQSRVAMRRGQKWPSRLLWIPFVALILGSAPLSANVMASMWLGFVPA